MLEWIFNAGNLNMRMDRKRTCVHIIIRDKFTAGYIDFLNKNDLDWNHIFFTFPGKYSIPFDNVLEVKNYSTIVNEYYDVLKSADRIIVAAFFDDALALLKLNDLIWKKIYIQFWGGDIYRFRIKRSGIMSKFKQFIAWSLTRKCILKCKGVLTLVEKDYQYIEDIYRVKNINHRVVQVPDDFYTINHIDFESLKKNSNFGNKKRIIVGNSATIENCHLEIFDVLKTRLNDDVEVLVPLSYGDESYKNYLLIAGKELLGKCFVPIMTFMARDKYIEMLSTCDVAIFNNNRQQATGNIILLANLGKKIYLRNDTSMWGFFEDLGFALHDVKDLDNEDMSEIFLCSEEEKNKNYNALKRMERDATEEWISFFSSEE